MVKTIILKLDETDFDKFKVDRKTTTATSWEGYFIDLLQRTGRKFDEDELHQIKKYNDMREKPKAEAKQ